MNKSQITDATVYAETERVSIRFLSKADEAFYCDLYTNPEVMRFVGPILSREKALRSFQKAFELTHSPIKPFQWRVSTLIERATQQPLGISAIHMLAGQPVAEVGSLLKGSVQAQGFVMEYSPLLITRAFTLCPVNELRAQVAEGNLFAENLCIQLGFTRGALAPTSEGVTVAKRTWSVTREVWSKLSTTF